MPEGVECLIVAEGIQKWFQDRKKTCDMNLYLGEITVPGFFRDSSVSYEEFNEIFGEVEVDKIGTHGKTIFIPSKKYVLASQLAMSGTYHIEKNKHTRVEFYIYGKEDNRKHYLYYNDIRKFGRFFIVQNDADKAFFKRMESSPDWRDLDAPERFVENVSKYVCSYNKNIKEMLMNQDLIVGIGNIYANEALFLAKINPLSIVKDLSSERLKILVRAAQKIMFESYKLGGMTIDSFTSFGQKGQGKKLLKVYDRFGILCSVCQKGIIQKIEIQKRPTWYCPICQKVN